jgi:hypothetical protein
MRVLVTILTRISSSAIESTFADALSRAAEPQKEGPPVSDSEIILHSTQGVCRLPHGGGGVDTTSLVNGAPLCQIFEITKKPSREA